MVDEKLSPTDTSTNKESSQNGVPHNGVHPTTPEKSASPNVGDLKERQKPAESDESDPQAGRDAKVASVISTTGSEGPPVNGYHEDDSTGEVEDYGFHNAAEMEAFLKRKQAEVEQRMRELNEETTRSEDLRNFLVEMHQKRDQDLLISQQQEEDVDQQEMDLYALAAGMETPDGGWGWLVVLGSFFCMITIDGICFNYGVLLVDLEKEFGLDNNMFHATWPGSILTGVYLFIGPLASALANQFDYRPVAMMGSFLATLAFIISYFLDNFILFTLAWGILGGVGFGLIYLPAIATVGHWFHTRRPLAVGLALCGSGIGTFIFGQTLPVLLDLFTFRESLFILASFSIQCMGAAVLFRPLELHLRLKQISNERKAAVNAKKEQAEAKRKEQQRLEEEEKAKKRAEKENAKVKKKPKAKRIVIHRGSIMQKIIEEKRRQRTTSMGSLDGMVITSDNQVIKAPVDSPEVYLSTSAINRITDAVCKKLESKKQRNPGASSALFSSKQGGFNTLVASQQIKSSFPQMVQDYIQSQVSIVSPPQPFSNLPPVGGSLAAPGREFTVTTPNHQAESPVHSDHDSIDTKNAAESPTVLDDDAKAEIQTQLRKEIMRPMYKKDIFFSGSVVQLEQQYNMEAAGSSGGQDPGSAMAPSLHRSMNSLANQSLGGGTIQSGGLGFVGFTPVPVQDDVDGGVPGYQNASSPYWAYILEMLDYRILSSPTFLLMAASSIANMLGFFVPFHFLPIHAIKLGMSARAAGALISYVGVANTCGRLFSTFYIERGWASQYPWADFFWINNISLVLAGVCAFLMPVCGSNYAGLIVVSCIYGICIAAFISLKSILIVEFLGVEKLTNAFGYLLIFQGLSVVAGQPIAGLIYNVTQNFQNTFYFAGASLLFSGFISLPMRCVAQREQRRWDDQMQGYHYASAGEDDFNECTGSPINGTSLMTQNQFSNNGGEPGSSGDNTSHPSPTLSGDLDQTIGVLAHYPELDQLPPAIPEEEEEDETAFNDDETEDNNAANEIAEKDSVPTNQNHPRPRDLVVQLTGGTQVDVVPV